jgi:transcriptional regulator of acetoin/glycerol metabolism
VTAQTITRTGTGRRASRRTGSPHLFLALQCDAPAAGGARFDLGDAETVHLGRADKLSCERDEKAVRIGVPDARMSSKHLRLERVLDGWMAVDQGSKNGTAIDGARVDRAQLDEGALIEAGHSFFLFRPKLAPSGDSATETLLPGLGADLRRVELVAKSRIPVLLRGETGTGKELLARAIHRASGRAGQFVAVNCGAIAPNLVESELFGYRKGAFSGATEDRPGLVRSADGGTLLLDEIGDLPLAQQASLLRVLQEEEVRPVGGTRELKVDLRVIAATHRDLEDLAAKELFRRDLLGRLSGLTIELPPLRQRLEDLGLLIAAVSKRLAHPPQLSVDAGRALFAHTWPGNIRELEKALSSAMVLSAGKTIELEHLPQSLRERPQSSAPTLREEGQKLRDELVSRMKAHGGNVTAAARAMGKARTQVQRWLRRYGIDPLSFRR